MRLSTHHLSLHFGAVHALTDLSLEFPIGSRTVIWGPAGGGKTSLLKCLAGLVVPTSGEVRWDEAAVASRSAQEKRDAQVAFGMVFQSDALFDSLTVLDNVLLPLRKRHVPEAEAQQRAAEAIERVAPHPRRAEAPGEPLGRDEEARRGGPGHRRAAPGAAGR